MKFNKDNIYNHINCKFDIIALLIILFSTVFVILSCVQKKGLYIDEIYSFILANSSVAPQFIMFDELWDSWSNGGILDTFIQVQPGHQFDFHTTYFNNTLDTHPPLYYFLLHFVCSFFPCRFNMLFGLIINVVISPFVLFVLYLISKELISNRYVRYLPMLGYGFSLFAIDSTSLIRMYMLLTLFTLWLVYIIVRIINYGLNKKRIVAIFICIYLGSMTQYYMIIFSFFLVLFCIIYFLFKKQYRVVFSVCLSSLAGVLLMCISYPAVFTHLTGSSTNNIGNEISVYIFNVTHFVSCIMELASLFCKNLTIANSSVLSLLLIFLIAALAIIKLFIDKFKKSRKYIFPIGFWIVLFTFICSFVAICLFTGVHTYSRYIYHLVPSFFICSFIIVNYIIENLKYQKLIIVFFMFVFATNAIGALILHKGEYMLTDIAKTAEVVSSYSKDNNLIVVGKRKNSIPTTNLFTFKNFDNLYMYDIDINALKDAIVKSLHENSHFVIYISEADEYKSSGINIDYINKYLESLGVCQCKKLGSIYNDSYYYVSK